METLGRGVTGEVVSALIGVVIEKAGSCALELLGASTELRSRVEELIRTLELLRNAPALVLALTTSLAEAVYEAEAFFDELEYERLKRQVILLNLPLIFIRYSLLRRLRKIQKKLILSMETTIATHPIAVSEQLFEDRRETSYFPDNDLLIGRASEKDEVINWLLEEVHSGNTAVLPIWGMGGIGKTALARHVYNDNRVAAHFELRSWVHVTEEFNVFGIIESILKLHRSFKFEIGNRGMSDSLEDLQREFIHCNQGKRFLIILDDVWNEDMEIWDELLNGFFEYLKVRSKILVTCRSKRIANLVATSKKKQICLDGLGQKDIWLLFEILVCEYLSRLSHELPHFETIRWQIANKLKGSPLAAKTVAGILGANISLEHWKNIATRELWELPQNENYIMLALLLSYHNLPENLKSCFTYLSLFPKGWAIGTTLLIRKWIAHGFFLTNDVRRSLTEQGREYVYEMLDRSLLQQTEDESDPVAQIFLHDHIYDMARMASGNRIFVIRNDEFASIPPKARHVSIFFDGSQIDWMKIVSAVNTKALRSLEIDGSENNKTMHSDYKDFQRLLNSVLAEGKNLKMLSIEDFSITEIPSSIENLKFLRYLSLSGTLIKTLPAQLGSLFYLQSLDLKDCYRLRSLPKQMKNLINLTHFEGRHDLLPMICFRRLKSMDQLNFKVSSTGGLKMKDLSELDEIYVLSIECLENVSGKQEAMEAKLENKMCLQDVRFCWSSSTSSSISKSNHDQVLRGLQPSSDVKVLQIENYMGTACPGWITGNHLKDLRIICFVGCTELQRISTIGELHQSLQKIWLENCGQLQGDPLLDNHEYFPQCLRFLCIMDCGEFGDSLRYIDLSHLKYLKQLILKGCRYIRCLPTEALLSLQDLIVVECKSLSIKKEIGTLHALTSLVQLRIRECPKLLKVLVEMNGDALPPSLNDLYIDGFPQKMFFSNPVRRLLLTNSGILESLPSEVLLSVNRLSLGNCRNLHPPMPLTGQLELMLGSHLKQFHIADINVANLRKWLDFLRTSTLTKLKIEDISELESFAAEELEGLLADIKLLEYLHLKDLKRLKELPRTLANHPSFRSLKLTGCWRVRSMPATMFPDSTVLEIIDCPQLRRRLSKPEFDEIGRSRYLVKHAKAKTRLQLTRR